MPRTNRSNKILSNKTKHLRDSNKKLVNITKQIKYFDNFDDNIFRLSCAITLIYTWIFNSIYTSPNIDYDINGYLLPPDWIFNHIHIPGQLSFSSFC